MTTRRVVGCDVWSKPAASNAPTALLKQGLTQTVGQLREWKVAI